MNKEVELIFEAVEALIKDVVEFDLISALALRVWLADARESLRPKPPIVEGPYPRSKDTFCWKCHLNVSFEPTSEPAYCIYCGAGFDWCANEPDNEMEEAIRNIQKDLEYLIVNGVHLNTSSEHLELIKEKLGGAQ